MNKFETEHLSVEDIDFGERARKKYNNVADLAESIKQHGLIHSIYVLDKSSVEDWEGHDQEELDDEKPFLLMAGGRRLTAYKQFDIDEEIRATICDRPLSADEIKDIELRENLERSDLTWQEATNLKKQIHDLRVKLKGAPTKGSSQKDGHTVEDTSEILGESKATTSRDIGLAKAMERMPQLAEAKTKADAQRMLKKLKRDLDTEEKAKMAEKKSKNTPLEKKRKSLANAYIVGPVTNDITTSGFFNRVQSVDDKSIDLVEIDPPYSIDLDKQKRGKDRSKVDDYNEVHGSAYMEFMEKTLEESYRVMKDHSWLILWFGPDPWFQPMLDMTKEAGFYVRGIPGIWSKGRGQTMQPATYLANTYEMFFYAQKGKKSIQKQGRANVFNFAPAPSAEKVHPTERPIELMEELLTTFAEPGAKIMVPFAGSGNTLLAASNLNMHAFGYDLTDEYRNDYVVRVFDGEPGKYKSY